MREREVQVEEEKIDDMTVEKTIGEIAEDAGEKQPESNPAPGIARFLAHE